MPQKRIVKKRRKLGNTKGNGRAKCSVCQKRFPFKSNVITHWFSLHANREWLKCACQRTFHSSMSYWQHRRDNCESQTKALSCSLCDQSLPSHTVLYNHIVKVHGTLVQNALEGDFCLPGRGKQKKPEVKSDQGLCDNERQSSASPEVDDDIDKRSEEKHPVSKEDDSLAGTKDRVCEFCNAIFPEKYVMRMHQFLFHRDQDALTR